MQKIDVTWCHSGLPGCGLVCLNYGDGNPDFTRTGTCRRTQHGRLSQDTINRHQSNKEEPWNEAERECAKMSVLVLGIKPNKNWRAMRAVYSTTNKPILPLSTIRCPAVSSLQGTTAFQRSLNPIARAFSLLAQDTSRSNSWHHLLSDAAPMSWVDWSEVTAAGQFSCSTQVSHNPNNPNGSGRSLNRLNRNKLALVPRVYEVRRWRVSKSPGDTRLFHPLYLGHPGVQVLWELSVTTTSNDQFIFKPSAVLVG